MSVSCTTDLCAVNNLDISETLKLSYMKSTIVQNRVTAIKHKTAQCNKMLCSVLQYKVVQCIYQCSVVHFTVDGCALECMV